MSHDVLFCGGTIYTPGTPLAPGWVLVREERIAALGAGDPPAEVASTQEVINLDGQALLPGMIDLHVHGALGHDTMDADPEALQTMARFYARHGVTGFLAATMTAETSAVERALRAVAQVMARGTGGATLLGAHLEGPYLDPGHAGIQDPARVLRAEPAVYARFFETGAVRLVTLAPEVPENRTLIAHARAQGVVVAMGHTGADYDTVRKAVGLGVSHVAHLFNGMSPLHHRDPGAVGAALMLDALTCELIVDLVHVHPAVVALAVRLKGPERIALVTDAMAGTGMPDGSYTLGGLSVTVQDGVARGAGGVLAGSTLTMDRALANMMRATGLPLEAVLVMATRVPARTLGLDAGAIAPGLAADLVVWDKGEVSLTMAGGAVVWRR